MIELTVKTLDSQNHSFSVEDDITVEQFKVKIADTVNIPADTQRIIYCGRVLQDNSKLSDYDVNGKVVHLVQRAPPSTSQRSNRSNTPPPPQQRRVLRGLDGNAMYLGSMAFPSNLMESQGIVPPPPTHSLAGSRLNVARRMLRRADAVIRLLENPTASQSEPTPNEDNHEDEVTPVIEARVIGSPDTMGQIDPAMVLSAVQNSLLNANTLLADNNVGENVNLESNVEAELNQRSGDSSTSLSPEEGQSTAASEAPEGRTTNDPSSNTIAENASSTSEMAELLTTLGQLQVRFAPFLELYHNFMRDDPTVPQANVRSTQTLITRVSEVLHFFAHAYHSLSDIIVRVRTPPQRPLLCRPILIQHSAVVQTGIPIQVETQINLSSDRQPTATAMTFEIPTGSIPNNDNGTSATSNQTETTSTSSPSGNSGSRGAHPVVALPLFPGIRIQHIPVEIRSIPRPSNNANTTSANNTTNNNPVPSTTTTSSTTSNITPESQQPNVGGTSAENNLGSNGQPTGNQLNFNIPNVEFFMDVTPDGIHIDSVETTLVGSASQANDLLRGALSGPPPEFLQSLMQMAGQIISRTTTTTAPTSSTTTANTTASNNTTQTSSQSNIQSQSGQNSQARGNTQTNPTTATHTRSTPRPHVHLAHQTLQGGFDPFLPCNSHHVTPRRRASSQLHQNNNRTENVRNQNVYNFLNGIMNTIRTAYSNRMENTGDSTTSTPPTRGSNVSSTSWNTQVPSSTTASNAEAPVQMETSSTTPLFANLSSQNVLPNILAQNPRLEQLFQHSAGEGETIFIDLLMLLMRNINLVDFFAWNNGFEELFQRHSTDIQNFFITRILNNSTQPEAVDRGVDLIIADMQPFLQCFGQLNVVEDIDMVQSVERLFRNHLPTILRLATSLNGNNIRLFIDQCMTTVKELCALTLLASQNGQQGVDQIFEQIMNHFMLDVPRDLYDFTLMEMRVHLETLMSNLNISDSILKSYIVKRTPGVPSVDRTNNLNGDRALPREALSSQEPREMELDALEIAGSNAILSSVPLVEDPEPLPSIVLGSESWHAQVSEDWVPIITRDAQKQRRQSPHGPFSDAYLSGMPSKRRKIVNSNKPEGSLSQVISESVRQAVTATGLSAVAPLESVVQAAGASRDIQVAYTNLLRNSVQNTLRDNDDFTADRFPNASLYFSPQQQ